MPPAPRHRSRRSDVVLALVLAAALVFADGVRGAPPPAAPPLDPPAGRAIRVAFLVGDGSNVIDTAGAWEVFQDVALPAGVAPASPRAPFALYTVAESTAPVRLTGGLRVVPDHAFDDAPAPDVVVVPAMRGSPRLHAWLRRVAPESDLVLSVCTGAFQLASAGLLDGLRATTHHEFWNAFEARFPKVTLVRGERYVESSAALATAGGLTSGIDLALRVVERYFGREVARRTAAYMEYRSPHFD